MDVDVREFFLWLAATLLIVLCISLGDVALLRHHFGETGQEPFTPLQQRKWLITVFFSSLLTGIAFIFILLLSGLSFVGTVTVGTGISSSISMLLANYIVRSSTTQE